MTGLRQWRPDQRHQKPWWSALVPPALLQQLKPGGRLVIPIGQPFRRGQFLYIYTKDEEGRVRSRKDVGVYFIPMTGTMMKTPAPAGGTPQ